KELRLKAKFFILFNKFDYIVAGGRVNVPGFLVPLLNSFRKIRIWPLVGVKEGRLKFSGVKVGAKDAVGAIMKAIEEQRQGKEIRVAIAQANNLTVAERLKKELEKNPKVKVLYIEPVFPALGVHTGSGTIAFGFYPVQT
ncbi:DegV family protein, partial [Patescibacteria group bacterium]|nr:DegV family protein [Patescibacteria group bacterium]